MDTLLNSRSTLPVTFAWRSTNAIYLLLRLPIVIKVALGPGKPLLFGKREVLAPRLTRKVDGRSLVQMGQACPREQNC
jgi:hypothetical protein